MKVFEFRKFSTADEDFRLVLYLAYSTLVFLWTIPLYLLSFGYFHPFTLLQKIGRWVATNRWE